MRNLNGRKFNKRSYFKNTDETCDSDHGIIVSRDFIQHYRYGMDWAAWIESSCWSRCWRNVYLAFARISSDGSRMGGQVQVAQCIGRGDREKAHKFAQAAVQLATLYGNFICSL